MAEAVSSESGVVLFVDDDPDVLATAQALLARRGLRMAAARTPAEAWSGLASEPVDVILLDLNFRRGDTDGTQGLAWLREVRAHDPDAVVVVVTGHSGLAVAVEAMKAGASDFIAKPWSNARFWEVMAAALAVARRRREAAARPPETHEAPVFIGDSPAMQRVRALIGRVAPTEARVLLLGPAGSGRTLAARALHAQSRRAEGRFAPLDVRGLPDGPEAATVLRETAASACGGTLFLDEAGRLPASAQRELLSLMEADPEVRLVSAVTGSREALDGLRSDIADRLAVVDILLPPLAARGEDVILLAEHFVRLFAHRYGLPVRPLGASAREALLRAPPSGEVRGLRQSVERAVVLSAGPELTVADFAPTAAPDRISASANEFNLARSERTLVEGALKRHAHNVSRAARELGLTRAALYRRMLKHGL